MGLLQRLISFHFALCLFLGLELSCAKISSTATAAPFPSGTVEYELAVQDPSRQYIQVSMQIPQSAAPGRYTEVAIPAWAPGSYLIRDFGRHVYQVSAADLQGQPLTVERDNKQQWTIHNEGKGFSLHYEVFADELSVRTAFVNNGLALLNTSAVFMYLRQGKQLPAQVSISAPKRWGVYTSLQQVGGTYQSPNYDELVDAPILMAPKAFKRSFYVDKTKFNYVVVAPSGTNASLDRLAKDAKATLQTFIRLMGKVDFGEYTVLLVLDPNGRGGLEHKYSTAMLLPAFSFDQDKGYLNAQSLLAHEFFHAWNVKRIHDEKLGPFDYDKEVYTDLLWFHEGFTETITSLALRMAHAYDAQEYLDSIAKSWGDYLAHPGRNHSSIAQLSKDAWIKFYRRSANKRNTSISYYSKGDLIGVCLDLKIRLAAAKQGRYASLASTFRRIWGGKGPDDSVPITKATVINAASREAGEDLSSFFQAYVYGTQELPLPQLLAQAGILVKEHKPWLDDKNQPTPDLMARRYFTGLDMRGATVQSVAPDSPGVKAGIHAHDEIIAVGNHRWRAGLSLNEQLVGHPIGKPVKLALFRRARLVQTQLTPTSTPLRDWSFAPRKEPELSAIQRMVLHGWLGLDPKQKSAAKPPKATAKVGPQTRS